MLSAEEQADFLRAVDSVKQTALHHLSANQGQTFAIHFVSNLHRGVDQVLQAAKDQGFKIDCQSGCSYCCHYRVEALAPEVFRISRLLRTLPPPQLEAITQRLLQHAAAVKGLSVLDYHASCAFLNENQCSIYPVRPAVCRKAHSSDVEKCKLPGADIPESLEVVIKSEALMKGTADAYQQVKLSASGHYELGSAVLLALTDESLESLWYGGELVF